MIHQLLGFLHIIIKENIKHFESIKCFKAYSNQTKEATTFFFSLSTQSPRKIVYLKRKYFRVEEIPPFGIVSYLYSKISNICFNVSHIGKPRQQIMTMCQQLQSLRAYLFCLSTQSLHLAHPLHWYIHILIVGHMHSTNLR